jgi:toxin-antitoxin system PIN domain toxin
MTYLLDVNLLIALFDCRHVNHESAHVWFGSTGKASWATCPVTENGFLRVLSNPAYPTVSATLGEAMDRLSELCTQAGHVFWKDDVSLLDSLDRPARACLVEHQQVTDFYLTVLAAAHQGRLATFDGSLARALKGSALLPSIQLIPA